MRTLPSAGWRDAYLRVAENLVRQAGAARLILTGTSACVDAVFRIDADRLAQLVARPAATSADDTKGSELLDRVLDRIMLGRGGELLTRWPAGPTWICALLGPPDRHQVGGTGPQASWALAAVGGHSILALADRSPEQLAVIDPRTGLCADGKIVTAGSLTPSGNATKLPHCILEFTAGTGHGGVTLPRSSRIILRFGDEPIERDGQFLAMTPALAPAAGAGLVSGLNGLSDENSKENSSERAWLLALARAWSNAGLAVIHHELAEFPVPYRLREAAGMGAANSLGLSLSELFMLTGSRGDPRLLARDVAGLSGARRVIVHADDWALAVHRGDPRHQEDVLLAGNAFAAARARAGQPAAILDPAEDASYTHDLPPGGALGDGWHATCVPAPHLRQPAGTVGLGDTFVAGVLLAESLPQADPLPAKNRKDPHWAQRRTAPDRPTLTRRESTMSTAVVPQDPGKIRGLQRVTSEAGFFEICALDHLSDFAELLAADPASVTFADVVTAKDALVRALSPSVSAFLLDARYGLHAVATGALPGTVGLMSTIEDEDYSIPEGPRRTRYREGWSLRQIKLAGTDVAKLLWFYRPDGDPDVAEYQRYVVRSLADECALLSLPLVVEPIWYPLPGENPEAPEWKAARVDGILASALAANSLGVDMLKVEFPGYVATQNGRENAAAACKELDAGVDVPWVILSAGVGYEDFKVQVEIACRAGASGYLAGRSIWRDAVSTHDPAAREAAITGARARLDELNAITRANGRPYVAARSLPDVIETMPDGWFTRWHPTG